MDMVGFGSTRRAAIVIAGLSNSDLVGQKPRSNAQTLCFALNAFLISKDNDMGYLKHLVSQILDRNHGI